MDAENVATIIEAPGFRIITTLRYVLFNRHDVAKSLWGVHEWKREDSKLLCLHRRRLRDAAQACSWTQACLKPDSDEDGRGLLTAIEQAIASHQSEPREGCIRDIRVRVLVDQSGQMEVEAVPMGSEKSLEALTNDAFHQLPPSLPLSPELCQSHCPCSTVYVDSTPTLTSIFTAHKTTFRQPYDLARSRAGIVHTAPVNAEVLLFNQRHEITEASVSTPYFFREGRWVTPTSTSGGMFSVTKMKALQGGFCSEDLVSLSDLVDGEMIWLSNAVRGFFPGRICKEKV